MRPIPIRTTTDARVLCRSALASGGFVPIALKRGLCRAASARFLQRGVAATMVAMQAPSDVSGEALPDYRTQPRAFLQALFHTAVRSAQPLHGMRAWLPEPPRGRTLVLGAGKAGGSMAQALEALWPPDAPLSGLVVTRYGHVPPRPDGLVQRIEVVEAALPPTAGSCACHP